MYVCGEFAGGLIMDACLPYWIFGDRMGSQNETNHKWELEKTLKVFLDNILVLQIIKNH